MGRLASAWREYRRLLWLLPDGSLPQRTSRVRHVARHGFHQGARADSPDGFCEGLGRQRLPLRQRPVAASRCSFTFSSTALTPPHIAEFPHAKIDHYVSYPGGPRMIRSISTLVLAVAVAAV